MTFTELNLLDKKAIEYTLNLIFAAGYVSNMIAFLYS